MIWHLQSSSEDKNLRADISANVHPPIKNTSTTFWESTKKLLLVAVKIITIVNNIVSTQIITINVLLLFLLMTLNYS